MFEGFTPKGCKEISRVTPKWCRDTGQATPKGCGDISQGLSEQSERNPWWTGLHQVCTLKACKDFLAHLRRAVVSVFVGPGVRNKRVPLANFLAPLRGVILLIVFAGATFAQDLTLDRVVSMYVERNL